MKAPAIDWMDTLEGKLWWMLVTATSHREVVQILHEGLGLNKSQIARGSHVNPGTVSRWIEMDVEIRRSGRLGALKATVIAFLKSRTKTIPELLYWLDILEFELRADPLTAIGEDRWEEVIEVGIPPTK